MVFGQNFSSISSLIGTLEGESGTQVELPLSATRKTVVRTDSNGVKPSTITSASISRTMGNDDQRRTITTKSVNITNSPMKASESTVASAVKSSSSTLSTFSPALSRALDDEQSAAKRRKTERDGPMEQSGVKDTLVVPAKRQLTREEKIAILKNRRLKEKTAAQEAERAKNGTNGTSSALQNPPTQSGASTIIKAPAKGSYAEVLARAKAMQETAVSLQPTKIVHKHHKVEKDKSVWQKKMADKKINSAGNSENEKGKIMRRHTNVPAPTNGKRPTTLATSRTKSATSISTIKKPDVNQPVKRKREEEIPKIEWKGTARGVSTPSLASKAKSQAREREKEYRSPPQKSYQPRYVYRDDSDDYDESDESDMEANPLDIEEEEELSSRLARKEDVEEEKREKERQRLKMLAKKKMLSG